MMYASGLCAEICYHNVFPALNSVALIMLQVKSHKDLVHFETAYVVKLHSVARLTPTQPVSFSSLPRSVF